MAENWKASNWDALIRGEDCPVCELVGRDLDKAEDENGIAIADLSFSRLFLQKNQYVQGYCVLMCHRHVIEPYELTDDERAKYFSDLSLVGRGLQKVFNADKLNYNILGNLVPHLHTHFLPRYFNDPAPRRPIDPGLKGHEVFLSKAGYEDRIKAIQQFIDGRKA
jgi:diadenosine tetraphosphate (Ap4A) HIT family hydrolase